MPVPSRFSRGSRRRPVRPGLELLETRTLPSAVTWPGLSQPLPETEPNDTADRALDLGVLGGQQRGEAVGTIGNGSAGAADVDWYSFTLAAPARVTLATLD